MGKVIINREKCKACYLCINVCPKQILEVDGNLNKKGYHPVIFSEEKSKDCIGCAICAQVCPDMAIEKVYK